MQFPGFWVFPNTKGGMTLVRTVFDETELDPATDWNRLWQNYDPNIACKGYVDFAAALVSAVQAIARTIGYQLTSPKLSK